MQLHKPIELKSDGRVKLSDGSWCMLFNLWDLGPQDQSLLLGTLAGMFPFIPQKSKTLKFKHPLVAKSEIKKSVTFFGGSFDPFHEGHMNCLLSCPEKNIVVVPDVNPHKVYVERMGPWQTFYELCILLAETPCNVYPGFLADSKPNPTADWITKVNIAEVNFLMGDDSFMNFFKWKNPEVILKRLSKLYVVPRQFEHVDYSKQIKRVKEIAPDLKLIILPDHPYRDVSSEKIRNS